MLGNSLYLKDCPLRPLLPMLISLCVLISLTGCRKSSSRPRPPAVMPAAPDGVRFENVAEASGIHFTWPNQPRPLRNFEAFGAGCAFLDYDNDGWQDILLVGQPHVALYHNLHNGHFEDVTAKMGLDKISGHWFGVAVGDYDGDGYLDILLTGFHRLALLHNEGGRGFVDRTRPAGLDPANGDHWGSSAGFMDLDGSGRLALVILNYVKFGPKEKQYCELTPGIISGCPPQYYQPEHAGIVAEHRAGPVSETSRPNPASARRMVSDWCWRSQTSSTMVG